MIVDGFEFPAGENQLIVLYVNRDVGAMAGGQFDTQLAMVAVFSRVTTE